MGARDGERELVGGELWKALRLDILGNSSRFLTKGFKLKESKAALESFFEIFHPEMASGGSEALRHSQYSRSLDLWMQTRTCQEKGSQRGLCNKNNNTGSGSEQAAGLFSALRIQRTGLNMHSQIHA